MVINKINLSGLLHRIMYFSTSGKATILVFIICLLLTVWIRKNGYEGYQFGQEIGYVSAALASGEGFSNVFDQQSGPTAWTPAFYTSIYAFIFKVFGVKSVSSYWALFVLRCILLALTFHLALNIKYSAKLDKYKFLLLPIFLVYAYFVVLKRGMDDVMFNVSLSMLFIYAVAKFLDEGFEKAKILLYCLAVIIPLSSISLFIGFVLLIILVQFSIFFAKMPKFHAVALMLVLILSMTGWGMRNKMVLKQFIPYKSNLWFELYLSNVRDEDGILKFTNFREYHPLSNQDIKQQYIDLGEVKFLEYYKAASVDYLFSNGLDFVKKIVNRAYSVFLWTQFNINNVELADENILSDDVYRLEGAGLLLNGEWICIDLKKRAFLTKIQKLDLSNKDLVINDWQNKKVKNKKDKSKLNNIAVGFLMSTLPSIALIFCLFSKEIRRNRVLWLTVALFLLTIGPYLIVSIHTRYQLFQMSFYLIFVFIALATLANRFLPELADSKVKITA